MDVRQVKEDWLSFLDASECNICPLNTQVKEHKAIAVSFHKNRSTSPLFSGKTISYSNKKNRVGLSLFA